MMESTNTNSYGDYNSISSTSSVCEYEYQCVVFPTAESWDTLYIKSIIIKLHEHLKTNNAYEYNDYNFDVKTITRLFNSIKDTEKRKSIGGRFLSYLILRPKMCSSLNQYYDRLIALIKSIPDSAKFADEDGMLPLHHYCSFNSPDIPPSLEVLELLLDAFPRSPLHLNKFKETPLHQYSGLDNPDSRVITRILEFCPTAATCLSNNQLPLHALLSPRYRDAHSYNANLDSIKALLVAFPEALTHEVTDDSVVMEFVSGLHENSVTVQTRRKMTWSPLSLSTESDIIKKVITDTMSYVALKKIRLLF